MTCLRWNSKNDGHKLASPPPTASSPAPRACVETGRAPSLRFSDLAPVGVEDDGGEAGERGMDHHARHRLVGDEVGVVMQQRRCFDGDALVVEDDGGREQHVGFGNAGSCELAVHMTRI